VHVSQRLAGGLGPKIKKDRLGNALDGIKPLSAAS